MQEGGHRAKAGQAVRLLDTPAARKYGAWDDLHGFLDGTAFSDAIKLASVTHYGHAGRAFLEKLTRDTQDFCALLERFKGLAEFTAEGGEGQDKRAAGRFAVLALVGEMATEYGITKWPEGEAIKAAAVGFKAWQSLRGRGNDERRKILETVSGFIERHGDARFSAADCDGEAQTRDRAGWWRDTNEGREYLFTADGMREALKGFDFNRALEALQEVGALPKPASDGKRARFYRIGGRGVKLYPVHADKLGGDHGAG
jgi:putative DNA primase/helicase